MAINYNKTMNATIKTLNYVVSAIESLRGKKEKTEVYSVSYSGERYNHQNTSDIRKITDRRWMLTNTDGSIAEPMYDVTWTPDMKITISSGDEKTGRIPTVNLLSGSLPLFVLSQGRFLTNVAGTCIGCDGDCRDFCYAINNEKRHHNSVMKSHITNTLVMRNDLNGYFEQIKEYCLKNKKKAKYFRYHSFGEIETYSYLLGMVEVAKACPDTIFYFYTKRFAFVERYLNEYGAFPTNLVCNLSEWEDNMADFNLKGRGVNVFAYDNGTNLAFENVIHCPAVNSHGKTLKSVHCDKCGICMKTNNHYICVYDHSGSLDPISTREAIKKSMKGGD